MRAAAAVLVPALAFTGWLLVNRSVDLGYASLAAVPLTVLGTGALALVARRRPRGQDSQAQPALGLLFVAGALLTSGYWLKVWRYPDWELGGVLVGIFNVVGFWWPAVLVALGAWLLGEVLAPPGGWPRFQRQVGVAALAGVAGIALYLAVAAVEARRIDRHPIDRALMPLEQELGALRPQGPLPYEHRRGLLAIDIVAGPGLGERPYVVLRALERALALARDLTDRKDVSTVIFTLRQGEREVLRFRATEADRRRPVWELAQLDRRYLKDGGRLDAGSLEAMLEGWTLDNRAQFLRHFRYAAANAAVRIAFDPPGPAGLDTAELYGAAWASANNIIRETLRYFPDVGRFSVRLPPLVGTIAREQVHADFRLQHRILAPHRVLGLIVRETERGEETLDPGRFFPRPALPGFQIALVHHTAHLTEHLAGVLYERVGRLGYVLAVNADATATLVVDDGRGRRAGPLRLDAGEAVTVEGWVVRNLGWLPRAAFRGGRPV